MSRRTLRNVVMLLALVPPLAAGAVWGLAHWRVAHLQWYTPVGQAYGSVGPLGWRIVWDRFNAGGFGGLSVATYRTLPAEKVPDPNERYLLGFYTDHRKLPGVPGMGPPPWRAHVVVPHWFVTVVAALPLAVLVWRRERRRHRKLKRGQCPGCGYDLRASAGRCPECGETIVNVPLA